MDATNNQLPVSYDDIAAAAEKLRGIAHRTPALTSRTVDERTGAKVFFKCENFQRMGAGSHINVFIACRYMSYRMR